MFLQFYYSSSTRPTGSLEDPYGFDEDDLSEMVGSKVSLIPGGNESDPSPTEETKIPIKAACVIPFVEEKPLAAPVGSTMGAVSNRQPRNHPHSSDHSSTGMKNVTGMEREATTRAKSYDRAKEDKKTTITSDVTDISRDVDFFSEGGVGENREESRKSARTWKPTTKAGQHRGWSPWVP